MLSLKIFIQTQQKNTTMRFNQDMSIAEVCKQIREKFAEGGADHGLFQPTIPGKNPARWLKPERTLQYYDLQSGDEVHYRKRHRPVKVRLLDDTTKTMLIDDSLTVVEITDVIGAKMEIKNSEEYSLQSESQPGVWLNPTLSLHENGVPDDATIILKKKFFFSDANVDRSDPMQLHLLYVQCHDNITSGLMPTQKEEAVLLAAIECQILYGNHDPAKHKKGWLELGKIFNPQWIKRVKEEEVYREHKKLVGMTEVNAKYRYVQLCRSLKTYGITSYEVREKKKGTKKLVPFYLGITRDSIIRMNYETKEIEKQWPLTHLRRWAASDKSFTLDFGDYEDDYMSLSTTEGDAISQLIGGYIDIILKKRKDTGRVEQEDDSSMAAEELVAPIRAAAVSTMTSSIGLGGDGAQQGREGILAPGQQVAGVGGMGGPQSLGGRGVQASANKQGVGGQGVPISDLASALDACNLLIQDLQNPQTAVLSPGDIPPEEWRKQLIANANAVGRNALELLAQANKQNIDKSTLDGLGKTLGLNVQAMVNAARHAATGNEDDISLLLGARAVSEAVAELLKCAKDIGDNPNNQNAREAMRHAAEALKAAQIFLANAQTGTITDQTSQDLILESAKAVAAAASELVATTYDGARTVTDQPKKVALTAAGKGTAAATNNLVNITKAIAPGMSAQQVRQHFVELGKALEGQCGQLSSLFRGAVSDPSFLDRMALAARDVNDAIAQMILASEALAHNEPNPREFSIAAAAIQSHVAQLSNAQGNPQTIRINTVGITDQSPKLIQASRLILPVLDQDTARRLMNAAKQLADATTRLASSSKEAASKPKDEAAQVAMANVAKRVQEHAGEMIADGGKTASLMTLRHAAKRAAADTTALVATSKGSLNALGPQDNAIRNALKKATGDCQDALARLLAQVGASARAPNDPAQQAKLVDQSKSTAGTGLAQVAHAKRAALKLQDPAMKKELLKAADAASQAIHELLDAVKTVEEVGQNPELTQALETLMSLEADLDVAEADPNSLSNVSGQTRENALELLTLAAKNFDKTNRDVVNTAITDPDALGPVSRQHGDNTAQLVAAAKAVASTSPDKYNQKKVIGAAKVVTQETAATLASASRLQQNPGDPATTARLQDDGKKSAQAVKELLGVAVGLNTGEIEEVTDVVSREADRLAIGPVPNGQYQVFVDQLTQAAKALQASVSSVVAAARINPKGLGASSKMTAATVPPLVDASNYAASANKDRKAQEAILSEARSAVNETALLLQAAKEVAVSGNGSDPALGKASQAVNDALARLLNAVAPGKREINEAHAIIQAAQTNLADPYSKGQGNLEDLNRATKRLAEAIQATVAVRSNPEKLGENAKTAAQAVSTIVDASKAIISGSDGISSDIAAPINAILSDVRTLRSTPDQNEAVISAAKNIAANSARLNSAVKSMAPGLNNDAKNNLIRAAQALATNAAELAKLAREGAQRGQVAGPVAAQLARSVEDSAKKVLAAAPVSGQQQQSLPKEVAQQLQNATRAVVDSTSVLVNYSDLAVAKPNDSGAQQGLSSATAGVGEAIGQLNTAAASLQPGVKECDMAIENINGALTDIDGTMLAVAVGNLNHQPPQGKSHQDCQEDIINAARDLTATIQKVVNARNNPIELAAAAEQVGAGVPRFTVQVKNAVATTTNQKRQIEMLKTAKELVAAMLSLVTSAKGVAANQNDPKQLQAVVASSQGASTAIQQMVAFLKNQVVSYRDLDDALDIVRESIAELDGPLPDPEGRQYAQCRTELTRLCREIAMSVSNLTNAAKANVEAVGAAGKAVGQLVRRITGISRLSAAATADNSARMGLVNSCRELDKLIGGVIESAKVLTANQKNPQALQKITQQYQAVSEAITKLLNSAKQGAIGERETEQAIEEIGAVVGDLDAAALFAAANQLEVDLPANASYQTSEAELFASSKKLADAANRVMTSALSSQEQLGAAAKQLAAACIAQAKASKETAFQVPDMVAQQDLLTCAKACSITAQQVVAAAQAVSEKPEDSERQRTLAEAQERVRQNVERLIHQTETSAAEAAKGVRELERAQAEINNALKTFETTAPAKLANPTNNDVIGAARAISAANAHLITSSGASQEDIARTAKETCDACVMILDTTKAANGKLADKASTKDALKKTAKEAVQATVRLLDAVKQASAGGKKAGDAQAQASQISEEVVAKINAYVDAARLLPGGQKLSLAEDFGEDLDELAEKELRNAAAIIEKAAASLLNSRAREAGMEVNFDMMDITDAILEAARAIALATGTLVKAAAAAQRERVAAGRDPKTKHLYKKDPTWASGLISAANSVAACTQHLVTTANKTARKEEGGDEDHLISCSKAVAAATAQLVAASKAKADPMSQTQKMLSDAAKSVAKATAELVNAAKSVTEEKKRAEAMKETSTLHAAKINEIEMQAQILKLERELQDARQRLADARKKGYANAGRDNV